jgi:hypothetical protein
MAMFGAIKSRLKTIVADHRPSGDLPQAFPRRKDRSE